MFQAFDSEFHEELVEEDQSQLFHDQIQTSELTQACEIAAQFFADSGHHLVSVIFCDSNDAKPAIRAYRNMPDKLDTAAQKMKLVGGCPPKKEAQRLLRPFDWFDLSADRYSDLHSMKFLLEVSKLPYGCLLAVPIRLGDGLAIFSVGINRENCSAEAKRAVVLDVLQLSLAMIGSLEELDELFQTKRLSMLEAKALMFAMQGFTHAQVAGFLNLSDITIDLLYNSAAQRLGASNQFQLASRAIADGEVSNIQLTDFGCRTVSTETAPT
ncbi:MAG: hypothetical protein ABJH63_10100 [Rhizobiaceae bacterium]